MRNAMICLGAVLAAANAWAAPMTLTNTANSGWVNNGGSFGSGGDVFVHSPTSAVLVFQLPDVGATADPFSSASLSYNGWRVGDWWNWNNYELMGLGARSTGALQGTDFTSASSYVAYVMWGGGGNQNNTPTSPITDARLTTYLNAQYAGGAGAGKYVFLRFSGGGDDWHGIGVRANAGAASITLDAVPEPGVIALLGLSSVGLLIRRRTVRK